MCHLPVPFEIRHVNEVATDHISPQRMRPKSRFVIGETLWSKSIEARLDLKLTWLHMPGDVTNYFHFACHLLKSHPFRQRGKPMLVHVFMLDC